MKIKVNNSRKLAFSVIYLVIFSIIPSIAFSDDSVSITLKENFVNNIISAISTVYCLGNNFEIQAKALNKEIDLAKINYNWHLGEPAVKLRNDTAEITYRFHLDADVKPLGINLIEKPEFSDTEKVTAKLNVTYQNSKLILKPLQTTYPIDVKIHISSKLRKDFTLFNLDLSKFIPPIELPLPIGEGVEVNVLSKSIKANAKPVIAVRDGEIEVSIKQEDIEIQTQGISMIPPQDPVVAKLDIDNVLAQTVSWIYEEQKKAIRKLQMGAEKVYETQKKIIKEIAIWEKIF